MPEVAVVKDLEIDEITDCARRISALGNVNPKSSATLGRQARVELVVRFAFCNARQDLPRQAALLEVAPVLMTNLLARVDAKISRREPRGLQGSSCAFGRCIVRKDRDQKPFWVENQRKFMLRVVRPVHLAGSFTCHLGATDRSTVTDGYRCAT